MRGIINNYNGESLICYCGGLVIVIAYTVVIVLALWSLLCLYWWFSDGYSHSVGSVV